MTRGGLHGAVAIVFCVALLSGACLDVPEASDGVVGSRRCADLPDTATSGPQTFEIDGVDIEHYCEMDFDGGGWTLVGRSASGGSSTQFGWFASDGMIGDTSAPYSLGLGAGDTWVSEILVGTPTSDGLMVDDKIILLTLPEGARFPAALEEGVIEAGQDVLAAGACSGTITPSPTELTHVGQTRSTTLFAFTDEAGAASTGLTPHGFDFEVNGCGTNLSLEVTPGQGILFVR